jgi:hypothetical protein
MGVHAQTITIGPRMRACGFRGDPVPSHVHGVRTNPALRAGLHVSFALAAHPALTGRALRLARSAGPRMLRGHEQLPGPTHSYMGSFWRGPLDRGCSASNRHSEHSEESG